MWMRIGSMAAIFVISGASVWGASWREIDKGIPTIIAGAGGLALDPATPSTLYSWANGGALFKSTDGAASWKIVNGAAGVQWLVIDPKDSSTIYAGTNHGLVKTVDGGATWTGFDTGLGTGWVSPLVIDPRDSNTLYAVSGGVIKSRNRGGSWEKPGNSGLPGAGKPQVISLTMDPVTPSTLYAVAWNGDIFKSTDGAESWSAIKAGLPSTSFGDLLLAVDPVTPSTIYAGSFAAAAGPRGYSFDIGQGTISKSTDGGQSWRAIRAGIPGDAFVRSLTVDPASPSNVYASYIFEGGWGVLKSRDGGETWSTLNNGLPSGSFLGSNVLVDPASPATIYAGYMDRGGTETGGLLKSTDGGASWKPANAGRSFIDVRALATDPVNAGTMYAGIGTAGVFKSVDGGGNWEKLAAFQLSASPFGFSGRAYTRSFVIDFLRPNILYALVARVEGCSSMDRLLFKSTDGGVTWSDTVSPPFSGCVLTGLVIDPSDPSSLYVAWGDIDDGSALFKSTDGGASWSDLPFCCIDNALVIDPTNPATLYGGTPSGVLKSIDGAATWSNTALSTGVNVLALDPANSRVLYAATGGFGLSGFGGLFKSTDGGANWAPISDGLASLIDTRSPVTALVIDPANPQVLYAGTSGYGVFRSTDGGAHWSPFNDGLTNLDARLLALAPGQAKTLYAGTGSGIFAIAVERLRSPFRSRR